MWELKFVRHRRDDALSRVSWLGFEHLMAQHYREKGYRVEHAGAGASHGQFDGGIDLKLYRYDEYVVVQCKHWKTRQVPHNYIHELIGVMHTERADRAIFVISGEYTRAAREAAAKFPQLQIIDGDAVRALLGPLDEPGFAQEGPRRVARRYVSGWMMHALLQTVGFAIAALLIYYISTTVIRDFFSQLIPRPVPVEPGADYAQRPDQNAPFPLHGSQARTQPIVGAPEAVYPSTPMTDGELKDWKRRNAESMKIIEKTTPEI